MKRVSAVVQLKKNVGTANTVTPASKMTIIVFCDFDKHIQNVVCFF